jgi:hypothetical protein
MVVSRVPLFPSLRFSEVPKSCALASNRYGQRKCKQGLSLRCILPMFRERS